MSVMKNVMKSRLLFSDFAKVICFLALPKQNIILHSISSVSRLAHADSPTEFVAEILINLQAWVWRSTQGENLPKQDTERPTT